MFDETHKEMERLLNVVMLQTKVIKLFRVWKKDGKQCITYVYIKNSQNYIVTVRNSGDSEYELHE
jgi:predicted NUDIX family phosphoesterase